MKEIYLDCQNLDCLKANKRIYIPCSCNRKLKDGKYLIKGTDIIVKIEDAEPCIKEIVLFSLMATTGTVIKISHAGRLVKPKKL